jgi:AraC family transcriptional regulator
MEAREYIEHAIRQMERQTGLPVTVVDHEGWFNARQKRAVFDDWRRSHKKLPCCLHGFCWNCRLNCRYNLNQLCIDEPTPHYTVCWKGIGQIAVPLRHGSFHYGVLFAGAFREPGVRPPEGLPPEFHAAYAKLEAVDRERISECMALLDIFAHGLIDYLREENVLNFDYDSRVRNLTDYLEAHYSEPIALGDVARRLGLSTAYASSFIKQSAGCNLTALLRSIRIAHARKLLATSEENLHEIALACGFSSEFHLSKAFKQQTGESPSHFRKRL